MSDAEISEDIVPETDGQEAGSRALGDSTVDAIASVVVIACLVAMAATFISGGLA